MSNRKAIQQHRCTGLDATFSLKEYLERFNRIRDRMGRKDIDLLYLNDPKASIMTCPPRTDPTIELGLGAS